MDRKISVDLLSSYLFSDQPGPNPRGSFSMLPEPLKIYIFDLPEDKKLQAPEME
jgi:hypothetical protein